MRVSVSFLGALEDQIGRQSVLMELPPGATFRDLLDAIAPIVGDRLAGWAWDRERRSFTKLVLVSRNLVDIRDEGIQLADGDEILVLPPIGGG